MGKQKRMIYIYEENVDFYEALENKSEFINESIKLAKSQPKGPRTDNIDYIRGKLASMDARHKQNA